MSSFSIVTSKYHIGGGFYHNLIVMKDDKNQVVKEMNGIATDSTGVEKNDRLFAK